MFANECYQVGSYQLSIPTAMDMANPIVSKDNELRV
jgi:hypothetical protein